MCAFITGCDILFKINFYCSIVVLQLQYSSYVNYILLVDSVVEFFYIFIDFLII